MMTQILRLLNKRLGIRLAAGVALSYMLLMSTVALAGGDNSSEDEPIYTTGRSGGSRGCDTGEASSSSRIPALILLVPTQRRGQDIATRLKPTIAKNPTFAWFVRAPGSIQMQFRLYEYNPVSKQYTRVKEIKDENFKSSPGIMMLSMLNLELSVGHTYFWQVQLTCDPNHPSGDPAAEAYTKVVQTPPDLITELGDKSEQATLYDKADLWYNALGLILSARESKRMRELKFSLLEQVVAGEETALREQERVELRRSAIHRLYRRCYPNVVVCK